MNRGLRYGLAALVGGVIGALVSSLPDSGSLVVSSGLAYGFGTAVLLHPDVREWLAGSTAASVYPLGFVLVVSFGIVSVMNSYPDGPNVGAGVLAFGLAYCCLATGIWSVSADERTD